MLEFTLDVISLAFLSGAFAWIRIPTMILIMLLADFTTLKGADKTADDISWIEVIIDSN